MPNINIKAGTLKALAAHATFGKLRADEVTKQPDGTYDVWVDDEVVAKLAEIDDDPDAALLHLFTFGNRKQ